MQPTVPLGTTALSVSPLCLGGNVFGWTADEDASFAVLDAYAAAGGDFIDTADGYGNWVEGNPRGASEGIIGRWMAARGNRDDLVIATKVGRAAGMRGLSAATIRAGAEASLERLATDRIDLYYAHADDPETPLDETMAAFDALVREGKVRHLGASNYTAPRLAEALEVSDRGGLARYVALQPEYNLVSRDEYEGELQQLCVAEEIACMPYYALASGVPDRQVPPRGARRREPAGGVGLEATSTAVRGPRRARRGRRRPFDDGRGGGAGVASRPAGGDGADRERPLAGAARRAPADGRARAPPGELDRLTSAHGEA